MDGESGRIGGVPNRGGLLPKDSFRADERADSAGPGRDDCGSARPGSGVCVAGVSSSWAGVGIWRTAGEPVCIEEGTGEPSRAMLSLRVTCDCAGETRPESRDEEGTACGLVESGRYPAMLLRGRVCSVGAGACSIGLCSNSFGYQCITSAIRDSDKTTKKYVSVCERYCEQLIHTERLLDSTGQAKNM